mgnify:CR=1 FL=1
MRTTTIPSCMMSLLLLTGGALVGCGDDALPPDAAPIDALPATGTFSLSWSISDGTNPLSCEDVGALSVPVTLIPQGGLSGTAEAFACEGGMGNSRNLAPGTYDLTIDIRASGSRSLLAEKARVFGVKIEADTDTPVAAQTFIIEPVGSLSFQVDSGATAGNCAAVDAGGGGIVDLEFGLKDKNNACVAAEFDVAAGSGAATTYTSNCTTPAYLPCIGNDQVITVDPLASGPWTLEVTGRKEGSIACYSSVSSTSVAGAKLATELGTRSLILEYSAQCDPDYIAPDGGM